MDSEEKRKKNIQEVGEMRVGVEMKKKTRKIRRRIKWVRVKRRRDNRSNEKKKEEEKKMRR